MKRIWQIFRYDLQKLKGNYAAIIIVVALTLLPAMYAWFNILASWDPYGNTGQLQVAVVNEDEGGSFNGESYHIGDEVIAKLQETPSLDWQFVDAEQAETGVDAGRYYASITLPQAFSKDILSIANEDAATKATIIYTSNEKINAIAPKITDKGATTLQEQINQTVVKTISEVLLEQAQLSGAELEQALPKITTAKTTLTEVQDKIAEVETTLVNGEATIAEIKPLLEAVQAEMPKVTEIVNDSIAISENVATFSGQLNQTFAQLGPEIVSELNLVAQLTQTIADELASIDEYVNDPAQTELVVESLKNIQGQAATALTFTQNLQQFIEQLQTQYPNLELQDAATKLGQLATKLDNLVSLIDQVQSNVANGQTLPQTLIDQLTTLSREVATTAQTVATDVPTVVLPALDTITKEIAATADKLQTELVKVQAQLPNVETTLTNTIATLDGTQTTIDDVQALLPNVKAMIADTLAMVTKVETSELQPLLSKILDLNVSQNANFLEQPVQIENQVRFPMANYGTAMTPFYTILSLWVGALLMVSILGTHTHLEGEHRPYQVFFGKYGLFALIAIVQSLIVTTGDIWLLGVQPANIPLFIGVGVLSSLLFSFFIYSCVSVFGSAGKVIGILLLVLQIAGSGGTFPIQMTPEFFQTIYPFLPFTYAISAMRETIGGIVWPVFWQDLLILGSYFIGIGVFALTLKKPINHLVHPFAEKFDESGLGE
ncbi:MAG: YhgE/Pip family protein [Culicoidibacterales bacterium]